MNKPKVIVILGPTASGKSSLAVKIAKKFSGEVVSADSRQVYRGLDIGTGKITEKEMEGVPHHLLDVVSPKRVFSVSDFKKKAQKAVDKILKKGKLPIICGGTGFYIQSLVDNLDLPEVKPNPKLRKKLAEKPTEEIYSILKKKDPERAKTIDPKNPHRLIRAVEVAEALGKVPELKSKESKYEFLQIGVQVNDKRLRKNISSRLKKRVKKGMIVESELLHRKGLSWKRMEELGLEYRYMAKFLKGEMTLEEMISKLELEIWKYAKRQKTWFKKDERIKWIRNPQEAQRMAQKFLKSE